MHLVLGSASPRRKALLSELGFDFRVVTADADVRDIPMSDHAALVALATGEAVDLVVVGPEAPLVAGGAG